MEHEFFQNVLAANGRYCVAFIKGDVVRQKFSEYLGDLLEDAAEADNDGSDAYFALATFGDDGSRTAANAQYMRSLFLDIDCGAGKEYPTLQDGANALTVFVEAAGLPEPTVVMSGGGMHVYWPLTRDIPIVEWKPLASALKALCRAKGLHADPAVTSDAARILRIPGTHNHKPKYGTEPLPVRIVHAGAGPTDPDTLKALLPVLQLVPDLSAAKAFAAGDTITETLAKADRLPSKFSKIVRMSLGGTGCGQIKHALVDAASLPEPEWRAALSIAWNCVDGEAAIHKLSAQHPEYTREATIAKAEKLTDMPHTCSWYKDNAPEHCKGCTHNVTSPIQLGVFVKESKFEGDTYVIETVPVSTGGEGPDEPTDPQTLMIPRYPYPYIRGVNGGVYKYEASKDDAGADESVLVEVYPHDLYVTGRYYDYDEHGMGEGELISVNLQLPHDKLRQFHIPVSHVVAKDRLRDALAKQGVLGYGKQLDALMTYIATSVKNLQTKLASTRTRHQMGWTPEGTFVIGEAEYTRTGIKLAPATSGSRQFVDKLHSSGTLAEWTDTINFYDRPGLELHAFGFLLGAGSPLLKLLNSPQVKGAVVNLVSNGSGSGKSTIQLAINSLFGNPRELFMESKDTAASRFHWLGTLNSICLTVDEMTNADPDILSALVYGSSSGRAAHRMEAQGNRLRANHTSWCSFTVTSSNAVMADVLSAGNSAIEGELKRVIDLPIVAPNDLPPKAEVEAIFNRLNVNYGHAGVLLMQYVVANQESVAARLVQAQVSIDRDANFERSDRFYSAVCACAFVVGAIGNELGLWRLSLGRIYKAALQVMSNVKQSNVETVGGVDALAIETLARYLSDNLAGALIIEAKKGTEIPASHTMPRGGLKYRYEPNTHELIVPVSDLKPFFVARRVDVKASMQALAARGILVPAPGGDLASVRRPLAGVVGSMGAPSQRCYVFRADKLPDFDEAAFGRVGEADGGGVGR